MNRFLDLGMITNHRLPASHRTKALNRWHHTDKFHSGHPNPILCTSRIKITIIMKGVT
jgi:hypothetical protein